jgi:hypothetical protein
MLSSFGGTIALGGLISLTFVWNVIKFNVAASFGTQIKHCQRARFHRT